MLKTGLVSVTFRDKTPEEIISAVKQCGLEGIEWGGDVHVLPGDVSRAREIRHLTEQAGLAVWAYGSYFEAGEQTPDLFPPVLESAKALGAPCIRIWAGTRGSAQADPEYVQRVISCTQAICDMASTAGIDICYEYHPNTLTDNCDSAAQTLRSVARDNLHLYWQPGFHRQRICTRSEQSSHICIMSMYSIWTASTTVSHWPKAQPYGRNISISSGRTAKRAV